MGKIIETKIDRFDGGIANDPRDTRTSVARMISNFDALTNPKKLIPRRDLEEGDAGSATSKKQNFAFGVADISNAPSVHTLYGLGVQSSAADAEVLDKDLSLGVTGTDFDDQIWGQPTANQSASGDVAFGCFTYYQSAAAVGKIYGFLRNSGSGAANRIFAFDPQGTAFDEDEGTLVVEANNTAQGLVHPKFDNLYLPYENYIASKDAAGAFNMSALVLPRQYYITSLADFGNYLAIACASRNPFDNSRLFLWDMTSTDASETIDLGSGVCQVLEEVDGDLIAISLKADTANATDANKIIFDERVIFRVLSGSKMIKFLELKAESQNTRLPIAKQKIDNRLYFLMGIDYNGSEVEGVWSIGRTSIGGPMALFHEYTTALTGSTLHSFIYAGDFVVLASTVSGTFELVKTQDSSTSFANNSIYETVIFDAGDSSLKKDLVGVTVMTDPMPTAGKVLVKYKKDEDSTWTLISTFTDDNGISKGAVSIETSSAKVLNYKEIQFRLESTGGAEITGLTFKEEITGKRKYE